MKPTWKTIAQRVIPAQMQRAQNINSPITQLTPTQELFRNKLLEELPPGIGTNATINNHITYIIIPTINRDNVPTDGNSWIHNVNHEPPSLTPLLATIYWHNEHIEIYAENHKHHQINRADPNWLQQLLEIITNAHKYRQQTSS